MLYKFKTRNHPEANGRSPKDGEQDYSLSVPLDDNAMLHINLGEEDFISVAAMVRMMTKDRPKLIRLVEERMNDIENLNGD